WWAAVITLVVGGMVAALMGFSYVFLWSRSPDQWAPPPGMASMALVIAGYAAAAVLAWASCRTLRLDRPRSGVLATLLMVAAAALLVGAWGRDRRAWIGPGLRPEGSAHDASVYALLARQGWFAAIVGIMGLYIVLRWLAGHMQADRPTTGDIIALCIV